MTVSLGSFLSYPFSTGMLDTGHHKTIQTSIKDPNFHTFQNPQYKFAVVLPRWKIQGEIIEARAHQTNWQPQRNLNFRKIHHFQAGNWFPD
jgi:hypothetical protein